MTRVVDAGFGIEELIEEGVKMAATSGSLKVELYLKRHLPLPRFEKCLRGTHASLPQAMNTEMINASFINYNKII